MIPNPQSNCILCGSTADLNTAMGVTLEDEARTKVQVAICDECAEDCTPKKAREAYNKKSEQIRQVLEQARVLGLDLTAAGPSGLVVARSAGPEPRVAEVDKRPPAPRQPLPGVQPVLEGDDVVSTDRIDRGTMVSTGGSARYGAGQVNVPAHASHDYNSLQDKLPADLRAGQARMQLVEGRGGQPLAIPALRADKTGITRIRVVKSDDQQLQRRAKRLAAESSPVEAWQRPCFSEGYRLEQTERRCSVCSGSGYLASARGGQLCPKCQGSGII